MFKCNFCSLTYANKSNRSRHDRDKHFVEKGLIVYRCNECSFTAQMLSNLQIIFLRLMVNWRCLWLLSFGLSFAKKLINSFTNNTWYTCYESCLCWLSYNKCRCGCCSDWCACCWWRRNQRHRPSKKWVCFFGVLETYVIGGNQPTDENQSIDLLQFMQDEKDQNQKLIMERVAEGPRKFNPVPIWVLSNPEQ